MLIRMGALLTKSNIVQPCHNNVVPVRYFNIKPFYNSI